MKQKVTPFLSVLLALSFLMPAALFAKPIEAQAASYNLNVIDFIAIFDEDAYTKNDITMPWSYTSPTQKQGSIDTVNISFQGKVSWNEGDYTVFKYNLDTDGTRYKSMRVQIKYTSSSGNSWFRTGTYSNGVISQTEDSQKNAVSGVKIELIIDQIVAADNSVKFYWKAEGASLTTKSAESGFWDNVKNALTNILTWLKDIRDKIVNGFTELGNAIETQFHNLLQNLQKLFDEVTEWLFNCVDSIQDFMHNVGAWFTNLGNTISGFFEKLWNRIWWGNENGESEYVKPTISNKLLDILATLQDYQEKLKSTIDTIGSAASDVASYISAGTSFVNGVVGVAGAGFTALIVFGIVFVLVRKVVGR